MSGPDASGFSEGQQQELLQAIETMQTRDSMRMYNNLVEKCFTDCVDSFRRKDLDATEEKCVQKCCEKFMKHSARVGMRFGEFTAAAEKQMAGLQGK
ncbi:Mitochondrial import inner membrane translocase subunit Tim9 [Auxenochlorella protothecoides]|uniref:Mitochondrial import inner membrane translocase subunit n=2 Tax=Auxenochlorella protothecoides TaxID=3075 RepID=A0A087SDK6_AUXPR|nr:Mitochondrial import inner membrane translocase subunit Tim9 [Auxenochlorella protothecoides]KFM23810.1 Mitochondrial import inner membrane translocase subunit Tim9 [Auxenochlorella protothecoides]RMZ54884.1 hypothetical protein APUTEX25_000401 [Auxenochlorella protothecoides]|eukprot:RMZ54884.1 hypothetical protein APUTEX25_000401 [Auxenochlorella protothecoides]